MKRIKRKSRRADIAVAAVLQVAAESVAAGQYPSMDVALCEMAWNQRAALELGVDLHEVIKVIERGDD